MKNGELIALNNVFSKVKLPAMSGDNLFEILSAKADISLMAEEIEAKAEKFRVDTKPEGVDEYEAKMSDPKVAEWWNKYLSMRTRLFDEELAKSIPERSISRDIFANMIEGLTAGEAELIMKHLVKSK